jgi:hypothetical protein
MILPEIRDKRFITIRRGGELTDDAHHLLAIWAAECAEHVLPLFADVRPKDDRPIRAVMESVPKPERDAARLAERDWQRSRLPEQIRGLVLDDRRLRNEVCWFVFGEGDNA